MIIEGSVHRELYLFYTPPVKGRLHIFFCTGRTDCSRPGADIHMVTNLPVELCASRQLIRFVSCGVWTKYYQNNNETFCALILLHINLFIQGAQIL